MILKEDSSLNIKLISFDHIWGTLSIATENYFYSVFIYFFRYYGFWFLKDLKKHLFRYYICEQ